MPPNNTRGWALQKVRFNWNSFGYWNPEEWDLSLHPICAGDRHSPADVTAVHLSTQAAGLLPAEPPPPLCRSVAVHAAVAPPHYRLPSSRARGNLDISGTYTHEIRPTGRVCPVVIAGCQSACWWCDRLLNVWHRVGRDAPRGEGGGGCLNTTVALFEDIRRYRD